VEINLKTFMKNIFLLFSLIFITQCSTIFNSGSQSFIAKSSDDREGVMVEITTPYGSYRAKLPTTVVSTPSSFTDTKIDVVDNCFNSTTYKVKKSVTPSFWGNILLGGAIGGVYGLLGTSIGMSIDYIDGYMWKMDKMAIVPLSTKAKC